jgi:hypothetical protein
MGPAKDDFDGEPDDKPKHKIAVNAQSIHLSMHSFHD